MQIEFDHVSTESGMRDFSLKFELKKTTVLFDPCEDLSRLILSVLVGLEPILDGALRIGGIAFDDYFAGRAIPQVFGHVFNEGIMLSNLSLRENLLLPYRWFNPNQDSSVFDREVKSLMELFSLKLDLGSRPSLHRPAPLKMLSYVRTILLKPQILMIDDPYYLLNKSERATMLRGLTQMKENMVMLIASADDDFTSGFAKEVIDLSDFCKAISPDPTAKA
ncbi:MAG: hypothetical protein Q8M98_11285 [Candidatus Cloacimonadaceae bacterium]|nr:hypothetical protein [Candidatus Cloacimonadaceae bacterium]MDP3115336.1 hypothetical protein [Candidatus Cloacimonadaceae bacterium]